MSRYAPPNELGEKPYTVKLSQWGHESEVVVYAKDANQAKYRALGRGGPMQYVVSVRRTPGDR